MKPELQRIKIAEVCGWKWNAECDFAGKAFPECWTHDDYPVAFLPCDLPDYLNSLDAMHEAEKVKEMQFDSEYSYWLAHIAVRDRGLNEDSTELVDGYQMAITSTAAQRAEAFLRTFSLWQE